MAGVAELRGWRADGLDAAAQELAGHRDRLIAIGDRLRASARPAGWTGDAAVASAGAQERLAARVNEAAADVAMVQRATGEVAGDLRTLQRDLAETDVLAGEYGLAVTPDGRVVDAVPLVGPAGPDLEARQRQREEARVQLADRLTRIASLATDLDEQLAAVLRRVDQLSPASTTPMNGADAARLGHGAGGIAAALEPPALPPPGAPAQNAAWWAGLPAAQRHALLSARPDAVGNLDGLPAQDRDLANRITLRRTLDRVHVETARLHRQASGPNPSHDTQLAQLLPIQGGLEEMERRLDAGAPGGGPMYLLGFRDTRPGQSIVAYGNPDTAGNVLTYVSGMGSSYGSGLDRSHAMYSTSNAIEGAAPTSVVNYVGYDAPSTFLGAASDGAAETAAPALRDFQTGLRASHEGPPAHHTVLGHSYGSLVTGYAARDAAAGGLDADDVIFLGSPGVGVDRAADLGLDPARVHAGVAPGDYVEWPRPALDSVRIHPDAVIPPAPEANIHGTAPTSPHFGAQPIPANPVANPSDNPHSQYWDRDSESLAAISDIAVGRRR